MDVAQESVHQPLPFPLVFTGDAFVHFFDMLRRIVTDVLLPQFFLEHRGNRYAESIELKHERLSHTILGWDGIDDAPRELPGITDTLTGLRSASAMAAT